MNILSLYVKSLYSQVVLPETVIPEMIQLKGDSNFSKTMSRPDESKQQNEDGLAKANNFIKQP